MIHDLGRATLWLVVRMLGSDLRLGHRDEARSQLGQLRRRFAEDSWEFISARTLPREAELLIDPEPVGPTTEARPAN